MVEMQTLGWIYKYLEIGAKFDCWMQKVYNRFAKISNQEVILNNNMLIL